MTRRWTPQRFVTLRRIRVAVCVLATTAVCATMFAAGSSKAVALNVNGATTTVRTYAMSVDRLLEEQGVTVRTHDLVESSSGNMLTNRAVVTVRSAYQITVTVDGEDIPFWTVINKEGPVTVIADGKTSEAPNGKLPAASILDSQGINVGKEDRVSVEEDGEKTILRVKRVTHGQETRNKTVPFGTRTVIDSSLQPGETKIVQQGQNGETQQVYNVTYVDGEAESETLVSETTVKVALDQIVAVGPARSESSDTSSSQIDTDTSNDNTANNSGTNSNTNNNTSDDNTQSDSDNTSKSDNSNNDDNSDNSDKKDDSDNAGQKDDSSDSNNARLWHPTVAQAQTYAAAAAAQRGWTGEDWDALVWIWNHESSWRWNAQNPTSTAYGIPQSLYAIFDTPGYRDDGAVQIDWGLNYIAHRYGSPTKAKAFWLQKHWY